MPLHILYYIATSEAPGHAPLMCLLIIVASVFIFVLEREHQRLQYLHHGMPYIRHTILASRSTYGYMDDLLKACLGLQT